MKKQLFALMAICAALIAGCSQTDTPATAPSQQQPAASTSAAAPVQAAKDAVQNQAQVATAGATAALNPDAISADAAVGTSSAASADGVSDFKMTGNLSMGDASASASSSTPQAPAAK